MLNSEEIIAAIHGSYATGSKNGFQNVLTLLDKMHVALRTPIVHVAGTNGKGSTCAMLESVLRRAGYHTGLYTSPFLQAYQERIRLDGLPLDDARMVKIRQSACTGGGGDAGGGRVCDPVRDGDGARARCV